MIFFELLSTTFLGEIIAFILGLSIRSVYQRIKDIAERKDNKKLKADLLEDEIITLDSAIPCYSNNNIDLTLQNECFFISFPSDEIGELRKYSPEYVSNDNLLLGGYSSIDQLGKAMDIENLEEMIEKHKRIVADSFVKSARSGQMIYNNKKFGIRKIIRSRRPTWGEENTLKIFLFSTDYFTHRVMRSVYSELKEEGHVISKSREIADLNRFYPFLTSFGLNSLLILQDLEKIVLVNRSKQIANMKEEQWHVSMNEGLNISDLENNHVDLSNWLYRGYKEELGIEHKVTENYFTNLFINMETFEIGISSIAKARVSIDEFQVNYRSARDSALENVGYTLVSSTPQSIKAFLRKNQTTKACKYCLIMYLGENGI